MISTVYIAKNVYGGDGLGRLGDGRVVFVPGAWAGESVKAEISEERRRYVKARLVDVVEPSPSRIVGDSTLGVPGCVYSTLDYRAECAAKEGQLLEFFDRARIRIPSVHGHPAPSPVGYRNKIVHHFARQNGKWVIGYRRELSHEVVDMVADPLAVKAIGDALPGVRKNVLALLTQGPAAVRKDVESKGNVTIRWTRKNGVKWWVGDAPSDVSLKETTLGIDFEVPANGFYQVNPEVGEKLVEAVVSEYGKDAGSDLLDLYCGVGVFGLCCRPAKLTGIESGRQAIDFARRNAANQGLEARFFAEQVGQNMRRIRIGPGTTVIVDPPRGGLEPGVAKWLADSKARRIFYVSCDPATLMRDLRTITGAYEVESVQWFDMFPRTARFETVVFLRRR